MHPFREKASASHTISKIYTEVYLNFSKFSKVNTSEYDLISTLRPIFAGFLWILCHAQDEKITLALLERSIILLTFVLGGIEG